MNSKSRELAELLVQYYTTHKHVGHSYVCISNTSDRKPRYLMSHKTLGKQWCHRAKLSVSEQDILGPAELHTIMSVDDRRPLIVDHFVLSKTLQELLKDIEELEASEKSLKSQVSRLSHDCSTFRLTNADLLKEVEVWRKLPEMLKALPITERLKLSHNPVDVIDRLRKKIEQELDNNDNQG